MTDKRYPILPAAFLTGLSPHVIRIWDQRQHAVEPRKPKSEARLVGKHNRQS